MQSLLDQIGKIQLGHMKPAGQHSLAFEIAKFCSRICHCYPFFLDTLKIDTFYDEEYYDDKLRQERREKSVHLQKRLIERHLAVADLKRKGEVTGADIEGLSSGKNCMIAVAGMSARANADALLMIRNVAKTAVGRHRMTKQEILESRKAEQTEPQRE